MIVPDPITVMKFGFIIIVRLTVATFKITGYLLVATSEVAWYAAHARKDRIGEAIGRFGQSTVDALADMFKYK